MSHTVAVHMVADQEIEIQGQNVNIHDVNTILVDAHGKITNVFLDPEVRASKGWLIKETEEKDGDT